MTTLMMDCQASSSVLRSLGITFIVLGCVQVLSGVICIPLCLSKVKYACAAIWTGTIIILTGFMGIMSGRNITRQLCLFSFLVLSLLSIFVSFAGWSVAVASMSADSVLYDVFGSKAENSDHTSGQTYPNVYYRKESESKNQTLTVSPRYNAGAVSDDDYVASISLHSFGLVLSFIEMVLALVASIISFISIRKQRNATGAVVYQTPVQQVVVLQQGYHLERQRNGTLAVVHSNTGTQQVTQSQQTNTPTIMELPCVTSQPPSASNHGNQEIPTAPTANNFGPPPAYAVVDTGEIPINL
ncbi:uncharacterized protein LOC144453441 isoform X1 [Glandiceps talaboti]